VKKSMKYMLVRLSILLLHSLIFLKKKKNQELFILKKLLRLAFQRGSYGISYNKEKKLQLKINQ